MQILREFDRRLINGVPNTEIGNRSSPLCTRGNICFCASILRRVARADVNYAGNRGHIDIKAIYVSSRKVKGALLTRFRNVHRRALSGYRKSRGTYHGFFLVRAILKIYDTYASFVAFPRSERMDSGERTDDPRTAAELRKDGYFSTTKFFWAPTSRRDDYFALLKDDYLKIRDCKYWINHDATISSETVIDVRVFVPNHEVLINEASDTTTSIRVVPGVSIASV